MNDANAIGATITVIIILVLAVIGIVTLITAAYFGIEKRLKAKQSRKEWLEQNLKWPAPPPRPDPKNMTEKHLLLEKAHIETVLKTDEASKHMIRRWQQINEALQFISLVRNRKPSNP